MMPQIQGLTDRLEDVCVELSNLGAHSQYVADVREAITQLAAMSARIERHKEQHDKRLSLALREIND